MNHLSTVMPSEKETTVAPLEFTRARAVINTAKRFGCTNTIRLMNEVNPMYYAKYIDMIHRLESAGKIA